jgi:hypothetical protein
MAAQWHFAQQRRSDKNREPVLGEFFATDAIRNPAEALVRESLQNSLDAGQKNYLGQPLDVVRIRILLAANSHALPTAEISEFFAGSWEHYAAAGNGLRKAPTPAEPCPYLVIEDFGTSGLEGDVRQWHDVEGSKNAFFYFFRAEGRTGKSEDDRGRWGIGKYVFPRSSRANSFFGFTVRRNDSRALLMGQAVLKTHECNGTRFTPDGGFGGLDGDLIVPVEETSLIDRFRQKFSVRRTNEPGLSIVIPWVDPDITRESLLQAVVRGYFYPILEGKLTVTVGVPGDEFEVNEATIVDAVKQLGPQAEAELLPLMDLADWASGRKPNEVLSLNPAPPDRPVWNPEIIPEAAVGALQHQLDQQERIALKVPLTIRVKDQPEQESYFNVFLVNDGNERDRTVFVREGIIISDVRARRARGIRSIVVVDHKPLASLLGDSENPAHTQWQKDSSNFRGKYIYGTSYISFVTHCVSSIISILSSHQREEDTTLLKDFFSIPAPPEEATKAKAKRKKKDKGKEPDDPPDPPEPRKKRYRLEQIPGGFRVCGGDPNAELPQLLDIRAAYEVRRGNAFKKYHPADFDLSDDGFTIMGRSVEVTEGGKNRLSAKVLERDFLLTVIGFDVQRDLRVEIQVKDKEAEDAADV